MANTPNFNLNLPDYGSGGWNVKLNDNFTIIDTAIKEAMDRGYNIVVSAEAPLVPKYGMIWIDIAEGSNIAGVIKGKYKVYNGTEFEEYKYTTDANLVKLSPDSLFVATDVEGALNELKSNVDKIPILTQKVDNLELTKVEISTFDEAMKNIKANDKEARQEIMNMTEMLAFLNKTGVGFYDLFTNTNYVDTVGTTATILDNEVNFADAKTLKMKPQTFNQFKELELNIYDKNRAELQATEATTTNSMKVMITPSSVKIGDKFYYNGEVYTVSGVA